MSEKSASRSIALALSGGGIRAMVFHMGLLRWMAERGLLESVSHISTVSGGSLLTGLVFHESGMRWPTSQQYLDQVHPALKKKLCQRSLHWGAARRLLNPLNWRFILSRANLLGLTLQKEWGITAALETLPETPEWSINGTTAENGKRFRFKRSSMGDYDLGYAEGEDCRRFPLAAAMAVSAAFPGGFGPLTLRSSEFVWKRRPFGRPKAEEVDVQLPFKRLHLYDGGVYDNLGLEPFFDAGRLKTKLGNERIVVSDAGAPLESGFHQNPFSVFRLKRVADVMSDQARALRVRAFWRYLKTGTRRGAIVYIAGNGERDMGPETDFAKRFPTTLRRLKVGEFERLDAQGHRMAANSAMSTDWLTRDGLHGEGDASVPLTTVTRYRIHQPEKHSLKWRTIADILPRRMSMQVDGDIWHIEVESRTEEDADTQQLVDRELDRVFFFTMVRLSAEMCRRTVGVSLHCSWDVQADLPPGLKAQDWSQTLELQARYWRYAADTSDPILRVLLYFQVIELTHPRLDDQRAYPEFTGLENATLHPRTESKLLRHLVTHAGDDSWPETTAYLRHLELPAVLNNMAHPTWKAILQQKVSIVQAQAKKILDARLRM